MFGDNECENGGECIDGAQNAERVVGMNELAFVVESVT